MNLDALTHDLITGIFSLLGLVISVATPILVVKLNAWLKAKTHVELNADARKTITDAATNYALAMVKQLEGVTIDEAKQAQVKNAMVQGGLKYLNTTVGGKLKSINADEEAVTNFVTTMLDKHIKIGPTGQVQPQ